MQAAPADQRRLLEIADIDARLRQAEAERRNPPQAARIQQLVAARQALSHELSIRAGARDDLRTELARIESDVKVVEARRKRDNDLLATVTNPKDAAGLEHELASLTRRQSDLEDAELGVMERLEQADAAVAQQEAAIAETNAEGARLSAEAKAVVGDATTRIDQLTRDRAAIATALPADLLALYERLAARGAGAGLLRARTCGSCHMMLSGTDLQLIRAATVSDVVTCPECAAILVRTEESGL
jgi:predicted  nucleic acid-binding Zn-ribbon protein